MEKDTIAGANITSHQLILILYSLELNNMTLLHRQIDICNKIVELKQATSDEIKNALKINRGNFSYYKTMLIEDGIITEHPAYLTINKAQYKMALKKYTFKKENTLQAQANKEGISRQAIWERNKRKNK